MITINKLGYVYPAQNVSEMNSTWKKSDINAAVMGLLLVGVVSFGVYALANAGKKKSLSGHRKKKGKK